MHTASHSLIVLAISPIPCDEDEDLSWGKCDASGGVAFMVKVVHSTFNRHQYIENFLN